MSEVTPSPIAIVTTTMVSKAVREILEIRKDDKLVLTRNSLSRLVAKHLGKEIKAQTLLEHGELRNLLISAISKLEDEECPFPLLRGKLSFCKSRAVLRGRWNMNAASWSSSVSKRNQRFCLECNDFIRKDFEQGKSFVFVGSILEHEKKRIAMNALNVSLEDGQIIAHGTSDLGEWSLRHGIYNRASGLFAARLFFYGIVSCTESIENTHTKKRKISYSPLPTKQYHVLQNRADALTHALDQARLNNHTEDLWQQLQALNEVDDKYITPDAVSETRIGKHLDKIIMYADESLSIDWLLQTSIKLQARKALDRFSRCCRQQRSTMP